MFTIFLYTITIILLIISLKKSREKTSAALKKAWKSFEFILPQFLAIILLLGICMAFVNEETIAKTIGRDSGISGVFAALIAGAVTLVPGFIAFPAAALLLKGGAGVWQIGTFISSLMMVGVITAPVEKKYFGVKITLIRNILAFVFSFVIGLIIYWSVDKI